MEEYQRYSLSYRANETLQVMDWIRAGQCGSIVGLRGSGKSNFIRFLLRVETQQHYLGQNQANFTFVLINLLSLTERTEWGVYEMIVNNVLAQLRSPDISDAILLEVRTLHQEMMHMRDPLIARQAVERCTTLMCQQPTRQLVLLFDEFDEVFRDLPAALFRCLRAIRDSYKDQISYIVVGTHDLASLRNDLSAEVDHFYRLVSRNPCWLGPYAEADARQMAGYLASKRALILSEQDLTLLLELSHRQAGLLKAILSLLWNGDKTAGLAKLVPSLTTENVIERECQKIWESLSEREKTALHAIFNKEPLNEQTLNHLAIRGLIRRNERHIWGIASPLFAAFVEQQAPPPQTGTYIHRDLRIIQLEGQRIKNLTELEFELLCYLYEQRKQICTKNDIIERVYQQRYDSTSDEMLQALILRLRKKIEPTPQRPRYIVTVRGEGYRFILPDEP